LNIKITDKLYLRSDSYCCWLSKVSIIQKGKNAGSEREDVIGYYRHPQDAFKALLNHKIRTQDAECLKQLLDAVTSHNGFMEAYVMDKLPKELNKEEKE
jgi:hypothetical protein